MSIRENVEALLKEIPDNVTIVAAAKTRTAEEITEAVSAGISVIGENYIKDLKKVYSEVKVKAEWHYIGTLQKNNIRRNILEMLDMIETIDSYEIAEMVNNKCQAIDKVMPVLIEVNSAKESQKGGVMPEAVIDTVKKISTLSNVKIMGLMTMGPYWASAEELKKYFHLTKNIFEEIKKLNLSNVEMKYLSMGMSDSYREAIEEGANIVRIGTKIFGPRNYD